MDAAASRLRPYLLAVARGQLRAGLQRRVDPEDIVQDVLADLAAAPLEAEGSDLLRMLRVRVNHRVVDAARRHGAAVRDVDRERSLHAGDQTSRRLERVVAAPAPGPVTDAALAEGVLCLAAALDALPPRHRAAPPGRPDPARDRGADRRQRRRGGGLAAPRTAPAARPLCARRGGDVVNAEETQVDPLASLAHETPLEELLAAVVEAYDVGLPPDRSALLEQFPRHASALEAFLAPGRRARRWAGQPELMPRSVY